jgi:hypothetical protein
LNFIAHRVCSYNNKNHFLVDPHKGNLNFMEPNL